MKDEQLGLYYEIGTGKDAMALSAWSREDLLAMANYISAKLEGRAVPRPDDDTAETAQRILHRYSKKEVLAFVWEVFADLEVDKNVIPFKRSIASR